MAKYTLELQSRNIFTGPEENSMSELIELKLQSEWSDDSETVKDFDVTIYSDRNRLTESVAIQTSEEALTGVTAPNYFKVRDSISLYPRVGFYGSMFKYTIQKSVPLDGNFKIFGATLLAVPQTADAEFMAPMDAISNAWE